MFSLMAPLSFVVQHIKAVCCSEVPQAQTLGHNIAGSSCSLLWYLCLLSRRSVAYKEVAYQLLGNPLWCPWPRRPFTRLSSQSITLPVSHSFLLAHFHCPVQVLHGLQSLSIKLLWCGFSPGCGFLSGLGSVICSGSLFPHHSPLLPILKPAPQQRCGAQLSGLQPHLCSEASPPPTHGYTVHRQLFVPERADCIECSAVVKQ